jgi:pterin-4a-carbinolamine dehydratase/catechol 2,3-dioxygenase-like lactoylglutathione lyase family enzyme
VNYTAVTADEFDALPGLADWRFRTRSIHASFRAPYYAAAADLLPAIAGAADELVHHPDVELRYPGVVHVALTTHATGGLTTLDVDLARTISALAAAAGATSEPAALGAAGPITIGLNHVATLTISMDTTVRFYEQAFGAIVTFEIAKRDDHPWMKILDLGGGAALNVFEVTADAMIGDRRRQCARGAIDHFALAVDSRATLEAVRERLLVSEAQEVGTIQQLGSDLSLFFRDPDGMELEVCCPA